MQSNLVIKLYNFLIPKEPIVLIKGLKVMMTVKETNKSICVATAFHLFSSPQITQISHTINYKFLTCCVVFCSLLNSCNALTITAGQISCDGEIPTATRASFFQLMNAINPCDPSFLIFEQDKKVFTT